MLNQYFHSRTLNSAVAVNDRLNLFVYARHGREEKTPQNAFRKPILKILKKHGGKAHRMTVLKELEKAMDDQLTKFDKSDIPSGTIRWQKSAEWEVRVMREKDLLKPVSETPSGVWALTEKGFESSSIL
jgi:septum formation topological specificity factor MinE